MPIIYDGLKTVTISFLKSHKYLMLDSFKGGSINWSSNGEPAGNIEIFVSTVEDNSYLELDYKANGTPINYRVQLVAYHSNLGFGLIWYFVCPATGKRCRNLYEIGGNFLHRTACRGLYEKQTQSKRTRNLYKVFGTLGNDQLYEQLYKKHFKRNYAGKPTRRYINLTNKIEKAERVPPELLKRFLLKR